MLAEMGIALREDCSVMGVFTPKKVLTACARLTLLCLSSHIEYEVNKPANVLLD